MRGKPKAPRGLQAGAAARRRHARHKIASVWRACSGRGIKIAAAQARLPAIEWLWPSQALIGAAGTRRAVLAWPGFNRRGGQPQQKMASVQTPAGVWADAAPLMAARAAIACVSRL
jgi:hypothetical protein